MSEWKAKRFWKSSGIARADDGYGIELDGRGVRTPAKAPLVVPTESLARSIAAEWDAQEGTIDPLTMPFTRSANAAIDKVAHQFDEVAEIVAAYGDADLLCYRADGPDELVTRQTEAWDPLIKWAADALKAPLRVRTGIAHKAQPEPSLARLAEIVHGQSVFELTALHDLVAISGSLVLGLATSGKHIQPEQAWLLSRLDEDWQIEQWGHDDEAEATAAEKKRAFLHAADFYARSTTNS